MDHVSYQPSESVILQCVDANCGKSFSDIDSVKCHMNEAHEDLLCDTCLIYLPYNPNDLKEHRESHEVTGGGLKCHLCNRFCNHQDVLLDHFLETSDCKSKAHNEIAVRLPNLSRKGQAQIRYEVKYLIFISSSDDIKGMFDDLIDESFDFFTPAAKIYHLAENGLRIHTGSPEVRKFQYVLCYGKHSHSHPRPLDGTISMYNGQERIYDTKDGKELALTPQMIAALKEACDGSIILQKELCDKNNNIVTLFIMFPKGHDAGGNPIWGSLEEAVENMKSHMQRVETA